MIQYVLQTEDVAIHYGGVKAVDGVDLTLAKGQIRGLIGPNGAGKSTVIDAITGRRRLTRGRVTLLGEDVSALGVVARRGRGLSRSFQRTSIFAQMPVFKQVELASHQMGASDSYADAQAVLQELDLWDMRETVAQDLGYGEQRRLDLALALVGHPSVLLLDEPMAGVEGQTYALIQKAVRDIAASGVAICVVEHNVAFIRDLCDEGVFMFAGKVLARGSVEQLIADPHLTELYFGT